MTRRTDVRRRAPRLLDATLCIALTGILGSVAPVSAHDTPDPVPPSLPALIADHGLPTRPPTRRQMAEPHRSPAREVSVSTRAASRAPHAHCRNSTDPACGPFHWVVEPAENQPLRFHVTITPLDPHVGDDVTVQVRIEDPDARIRHVRVEFEGPWIGLPMGPMRPRFGPWYPPSPIAGTYTRTYHHVFSDPGATSIDVWADSGAWSGGWNPYGDGAVEHYPIEVAPAP